MWIVRVNWLTICISLLVAGLAAWLHWSTLQKPFVQALLPCLRRLDAVMDASLANTKFIMALMPSVDANGKLYDVSSSICCLTRPLLHGSCSLEDLLVSIALSTVSTKTMGLWILD